MGVIRDWLYMGGFIAATGAMAAAIIHDSDVEREHKTLIQQAVKHAAGNDRIWSTHEKREFLDYTGFHDAVLQEGQDLYFRSAGRKGIEVVAGSNLENNGGFLHGSSAESGTSLGMIHPDSLRTYIKHSSSSN